MEGQSGPVYFSPDRILCLDPENNSLLAVFGTITDPVRAQGLDCSAQSWWDYGPLGMAQPMHGSPSAPGSASHWEQPARAAPRQTSWILSCMNVLNCTQFTAVLFSVRHALKW